MKRIYKWILPLLPPWNVIQVETTKLDVCPLKSSSKLYLWHIYVWYFLRPYNPYNAADWIILHSKELFQSPNKTNSFILRLPMWKNYYMSIHQGCRLSRFHFFLMNLVLNWSIKCRLVKKEKVISPVLHSHNYNFLVDWGDSFHLFLSLFLGFLVS